ncbi:FPR1 [Symbiodinium natans]|uniref:peptidylprolyl isomerase n=1 Tax=Symbiodinium natans TaxID=878477 RepID=A0A812JKN2_9DINO|nr:FPR1 [Symbiodinium natans]
MGVRKQIRKDGDGRTFPKKGDKLKMHYVGTFANTGEVFDSSRGKEPIEFTVGVGQVIRGWDEGVMQMSKGEHAILEITSDFAYGRAGVRGLIPPNANLVFEVELLEVGNPKDAMDHALSCACYAGVAILVLKVCGCV